MAVEGKEDKERLHFSLKKFRFMECRGREAVTVEANGCILQLKNQIRPQTFLLKPTSCCAALSEELDLHIQSFPLCVCTKVKAQWKPRLLRRSGGRPASALASACWPATAAVVAASGPLREFEKSTVKRAPMMATSTECCIRIRFSRGGSLQQDMKKVELDVATFVLGGRAEATLLHLPQKFEFNFSNSTYSQLQLKCYKAKNSTKISIFEGP